MCKKRLLVNFQWKGQILQDHTSTCVLVSKDSVVWTCARDTQKVLVSSCVRKSIGTTCKNLVERTVVNCENGGLEPGAGRLSAALMTKSLSGLSLLVCISTSYT